MNNIAIEEALGKFGVYSCRPIGTSMFPTIDTERDTVVLRKKEGRLNQYDVALYRRADGTCVLHRVMALEEHGYTMCGDNQCQLEHGVKEEAVFAYLDGLYRGDKYISFDKKLYRFYVKLWCSSFLFRKIALRILWFIKNHFRKKK